MYNLLVSADGEAWDSKIYKYHKSRVFENTVSTISERFSKFDSEAIETLMSLPTLFAYESFNKKPARLGSITDIQLRDRQVRIMYKIDRNFEPIPMPALEQLSWELDIGNDEMYRTHWAIKDENLIDTLLKAGLIDERSLGRTTAPNFNYLHPTEPDQLIVKPRVFRCPSNNAESDLIAVLMPFKSSFTKVYESIQQSCAKAGFRCQRADELWDRSDVMQDIFNLLFKSRIVVVDFSGKNPNVMYEIGIAHTIGRPVVPIAQSIEDVPFDLRHHRILTYSPNSEGLTEMRNVLSKLIVTLASK